MHDFILIPKATHFGCEAGGFSPPPSAILVRYWSLYRRSQNLTQHIVKTTNVANMEKGYQRITLDERIIIEKQLALGCNHSQIAAHLAGINLLFTEKSSVAKRVSIQLWKVPVYRSVNLLTERMENPK